MVKTLLGRDKNGDPRLLITGSGDHLDPLNPDVLYDSETSALRVIQRGYVAIDDPITVLSSPVGVNVTRYRKVITFPPQATPPMIIVGVHRPGSGVYWTRRAEVNQAPDDLLRGDWLISPSICRQQVANPSGGIARYRIAYYYSVRATVVPDEEDVDNSLTITCYAPLGGTSTDLYYASYMLLNVE